MNLLIVDSAALATRLEEKNVELQETLERLQAANLAILDLNRDLETRVRQRTAELQCTSQELESFCYSVSRDLRAPLRAISGYTGIVLRDHAGELPPGVMQLLGRIEENAGSMGRLIDHLLDIARLGRKALSLQRLNLAHLARECLKELAPQQHGRNVEIRIGEMPLCHGDPILIKQALLNLLSNALKYSRKREAALIEIGGEIRDGEFLGRVRDNGAGFDMKYSDKLFQVFRRLHSRSEFEGTGIGLAIVKRVIEKHGGRVWVEAARDQGAAFHFSLPEPKYGT